MAEDNTRDKYRTELEGLSKLERYLPAVAAAEFYEEKNKTAAKGALEKLLLSLDLGKDGAETIESLRKTEEGSTLLKDIYSNAYAKLLNSSKVPALFLHYQDSFREYLDADTYKRAEQLYLGTDETYKDITKKMRRAGETLKDEDSSEEDKEKAKDVFKKYGKIIKYIDKFGELKVKDLKNPLEKEALKKEIAEDFKE